MARYLISKKLEKRLKPIKIISKNSYIANKKLISKGVQIFPKSMHLDKSQTNIHIEARVNWDIKIFQNIA